MDARWIWESCKKIIWEIFDQIWTIADKSFTGIEMIELWIFTSLNIIQRKGKECWNGSIFFVFQGTNYWRNRVMKVGKEYTDLAFAVANVHDMGRELSEYGMDNPGSDDKPVVAVRTSKGTKYLMSAEFSMDNLKAFLDDFKAGKLEPYMKSEPVPASNDAGVKVRKAWQLHSIIRRSRYVAKHI